MSASKNRKTAKHDNTIPVPRELLKAKTLSAIVGGEKISLSTSDIVIYSYMRYRMGLHSAYYENQTVIAEETGVSTRSVIRFVEKMLKLELLRLVKKGLGGCKQSNQYTWLASPQEVLSWFDSKDGSDCNNVVPIKAIESPSITRKSPPIEVGEPPRYSDNDYKFLKERYKEYKALLSSYNDARDYWNGDVGYMPLVTFEDFTPEIFRATLEMAA